MYLEFPAIKKRKDNDKQVKVEGDEDKDVVRYANMGKDAVDGGDGPNRVVEQM